MTDTELFRDQIDLLDGGISDSPDLASIRAAGGRMRRRRRAAAMAAGGAMTAVLVAPAVVLSGGADDRGVAGAPTAGSGTVAEVAGPADAGFGSGMRAAVTDTFPGAVEDPGTESLGDRWVWRDETTLDWEVGDPPRWATLFGWSQQYDVGGAPVSVVASREPSDPVVDPATAGYCREGLYLEERDCRTREVQGRVVVVHEGTRVRGQAPGVWGIDVDVYGAQGTRELGSLVRIGTRAQGPDWEQARSAMPAVEDLVDLALDGRLVLPEPDRYPRQFPADRPTG